MKKKLRKKNVMKREKEKGEKKKSKENKEKQTPLVLRHFYITSVTWTNSNFFS